MTTATANAPATPAPATITSPPTAPATRPPLWPQPIQIIGLTGEYMAGKTLFGLTIDPARTLVFDMEKSAASYQSLGFTRVDMGVELLKRFPAGYKPKQAFEWWLDSVKRIQPGQFSVIMIDPVSEVESGLVDWVEDNPGFFGHTKGQYERMTGIMWGDVKEYWKLILNDLASRCESFVFTSHLTSVWENNQPVKGKRKPKGKETLMELASLYLHLERRPDAKGNVPDAPTAIVMKSRLATTKFDAATGEVAILPSLPPRIPVATPKEIRAYMLAPPDYSKLKAGERLQEERMTDDERLQLQVAKAQAEAESERLRGERLGSMADAAARHAAMAAAAATANPSANGVHAAPAAATSPPPVATAPPTSPPTSPPPDAPITDAQLQDLAAIRTHMFVGMGTATDADKTAAWKRELATYGVESAKALTAAKAEAFIDNLRKRVIPF